LYLRQHSQLLFAYCVPCCLLLFTAACSDMRRQQFSPVLRYFLWVMAEIAIIGSDIQEVRAAAAAGAAQHQLQ
jgi:Mn2+/Fe2+ NRAMP family transporter